MTHNILHNAKHAAQQFVNKASSYQEVDYDNLNQATELLARLRNARRQLDTVKREVTAEWRTCTNNVNRSIKSELAGLEQEAERVESLILEFVSPNKPDGKELSESIPIRGVADSLASIDYAWEWKVEDLHAVPAKYLKPPEECLNSTELRTLFSEAKKEGRLPRKVPGLKIVGRPVVRTRVAPAS